jgi:hypothetical protein
MQSGDTMSAALRLRNPAGTLCAPAINFLSKELPSAEPCSGAWELRLKAVVTFLRNACVRNVERFLCFQSAARLDTATSVFRSAFCFPLLDPLSKNPSMSAVTRQEDS